MTPRQSIPVRHLLAIVATAIVVACPSRSRAAYTVPPAAEITAIRIGFHGAYKLGCWTQIEVTLQGGDEPASGVVQVITADPDGIATTVSTAPDELVRVAAHESATTNLFVRLGQEKGPLTVRFLDDSGKELAARTFTRGSVAAAEGGFTPALTATDKLVVTFGAAGDLAADLARTDNDAATTAGVRTALVDDARNLPTQWYGYESVDAVILSGSRLKSYADAATLAPRIAALNRWVELGGELVIFCGAGSADLLTAFGPLAPVLPGRFDGEIVPLADAAPLEVFSGAASEVPRRTQRTTVPRILEPQGRLLAEGPGKLPLVIRTRRGLGEITFVAVDPDADPFTKWADRTNLLRQALRWPTRAQSGAANRGAGASAAADLTNQLRSALDQQFTAVATAPFALVALLVIGYIAIVGPGDYFLLKWIKRPQLTWLTIPLVVAASCAGAYALAHRMKGDELRVNQVEIVDVDVATGAARGTVWTHIFNPRVERYDLKLEPRFANKSLPQAPPDLAPSASNLEPPSSATLISWLGIPGNSLGGMQGTRGQPPLFDDGYAYSPALDQIDGLPIEQWSTKSLTALWTGQVGPTIDAQLRALGDDQLAGRLTNNTGVRLEECLLIRGAWAYQLPALDDGDAVTIDKSLVSKTLRTMLTSRDAGDDRNARTADDDTVIFDARSTDVARIVKMMMFYERVGGAAYTGTPHRYQNFIDMSQLLQGDEAILLARAPADGGSEWIRLTDSGLRSKGIDIPSAPRKGYAIDSKHAHRWTYYRFVIPLPEREAPAPTTRPILGPSAVP